MNMCELNKFIDASGDIPMDCYKFDPVNEEATISKGSESVVIDLTMSSEDQLSKFQLFIDNLNLKE